MTATGTLRFDDIVKSFGGTRTLNGVSFELRHGQIVASLGENSSGKSNPIKILSGAPFIHGNASPPTCLRDSVRNKGWSAVSLGMAVAQQK